MFRVSSPNQIFLFGFFLKFYFQPQTFLFEVLYMSGSTVAREISSSEQKKGENKGDEKGENKE